MSNLHSIIYLAAFFVMSMCPEYLMAQMAAEQDSLVRDAADFLELRIDPGFADVIHEEALFDSVKYIFLETNRTSEFSIVSQLEVTDKHYIIFDKRLQTILFFYKDGRFDKKLSAPMDFKRTNGFIIQPAKQTLIVNDLHTYFNYVFDMEGEPKGKTKKTTALGRFAYFGDFKLQYNGFNVTTDTGIDSITHYANFVITSEKDSSQQRYLWFNPHDSLGNDIFSDRCFYRSGEIGILFAREFDNMVYRIDNTGHLQRQFKIILPLHYSLPLDFVTNTSYRGERIQFLLETPHLSHKVSDVYQVGHWLTFCVFPQQPLLYNLTSGDCFDFTGIESDQSVLSAKDVRKAIAGVDDQAFVAPLSHISLKRLYNQLPPADRIRLSEDFRKAADKAYHNPILILLYAKNL